MSLQGCCSLANEAIHAYHLVYIVFRRNIHENNPNINNCYNSDNSFL